MSEAREILLLRVNEKNVRLCVSLDRGSDRTLGSLYKKFCTQVFWRKFSVEIVNQPNCFNRSKMGIICILNKQYLERPVISEKQTHQWKAGSNVHKLIYLVIFIHFSKTIGAKSMSFYCISNGRRCSSKIFSYLTKLLDQFTSGFLQNDPKVLISQKFDRILRVSN